MIGPLREFAFTAAPGDWRLCRAAPVSDIAHIVSEYWEVEGSLQPFREKVLPNGFLELMINLGPRHRLITGQRATEWEHSWLSGLQERALEIESQDGTHLISARLHPLGAREIVRDAAAMTNCVIDLRHVFGGAAEQLRTDLLSVSTAAERFQCLDRFVREQPRHPSAAPFVRDAADLVVSSHGRVRVSTVHAGLGVSRKHLAVSFRQALGLSVKSYAQIHRFAWTVSRLQESMSVDWSALADESGYADQSHMVRDFQRVARANPTRFLRQQTPDGSALLLDEAG